jgi:hypothetical protein
VTRAPRAPSDWRTFALAFSISAHAYYTGRVLFGGVIMALLGALFAANIERREKAAE